MPFLRLFRHRALVSHPSLLDYPLSAQPSAHHREIIAHLLEGDGRPSPEVFGLFAGLTRAACASRYDSICQWIEALPSEE